MFYEDFSIGQTLPSLVKGPMSSAHIMRWSAATENWHRIHYDKPFAVDHDKLPDILVNGSWKQHVLVQQLIDAIGEHGWIWRLKFRYKAMATAGAVLSAGSEIKGMRVVGDIGVVQVKIWITDQSGIETTSGAAILVVPTRASKAIAYPFVPSEEIRSMDMIEEIQEA